MVLKSLNKIYKWVNKNNFLLNILKNCSDEVNFDNKLITIKNYQNNQTQLIILLHECGHILIYNQRKKYKNKSIAGSTWKEWHNYFNLKKNNKIKISILEEEIEAWNRGKKLANRLKIKVVPKVWNYYRTKCLMTYKLYT